MKVRLEFLCILQEKMDRIRWHMIETRNVCTTKVVDQMYVLVMLSLLLIMPVMNQGTNIQSINVHELKEHEQRLKKIVICGVKKENMETSMYLEKRMWMKHLKLENIVLLIQKKVVLYIQWSTI